jgi:indole-3-glycerol phosphate synthase
MRVSENVPGILQEIVAAKRVELARVEQETPLLELQERVAGLQQSQSQSLSKALRGPQRGVALIAEVKMASPSAGRLVDDAKRSGLPLLYAENGASAISVLTEQAHFCGRLEHLTEAKSSLQLALGDDAPPLLRKDFLLEPYQVWESKAAGADAILLIAALLSVDELAYLLLLARDLGMECLIEAHDEREVAQALTAGAAIIGINNRDLRTLEVDLATTERLRPLVPADRIVVSESGIRTRMDIERLAACGVDAVLIGEALVRADDPAAKMLELFG